MALTWRSSIRQTHRWQSILFTMTVVGNFADMAFEKPPPWVTYAPLALLFLMLLSGLSMVFLPYPSKGAMGRPTLDNRQPNWRSPR